MNKKRIWRSMIFGVVAVAVVVFVVPALSQGPSLPPGDYDLEEGQYVFNVPALGATAVPATDTPIPDTPVPPSATPSGTIEPFAGALSCLDSNGDGHQDVPISLYPDTRAYHDLWNEVDGCYYNHEHKGNIPVSFADNGPHSLDGVFGTEFYVWAGGEISYPWLRPGDGSGKENLMWPDGKHQAYGWLIRGGGAWCVDGESCITDVRLLYHATMAYVGATGRFHSFWLEARVCDADNNCGILRTGGWMDYGCLVVDKVQVALPGDPTVCSSSNVREHKGPGATEGIGRALWFGARTLGDPKPFPLTFVLLTSDAWGPVNPDNPGDALFWGGRYNASEFGLYGLNIRASRFGVVDDDGDGFFNFSGYTDRFGNTVAGCTEIGTDCVPFEMINVPVGFSKDLRDKQTIGLPSSHNYDLGFGQWIEFPN